MTNHQGTEKMFAPYSKFHNEKQYTAHKLLDNFL